MIEVVSLLIIVQWLESGLLSVGLLLCIRNVRNVRNWFVFLEGVENWLLHSI